ncbi:MAG: toll/interleukin-1 receptor domain-containing protein [Terricaulis sp.]
MTDVFISYTRDERARCVLIADRLKALGLDVWFDANLTSGTSFDREIEDRVRAAKAVVVLWSPKAVQSNWVRSEATIGQQRDVLVSVEIVPCTLPIAFTNTHTEYLHSPKFGPDDPVWTNILARIAQLTRHPGLARFRDLAPTPVRRRAKTPVLAIFAAAALVAGVGAGGFFLWSQDQGEAAQAVEPASVASTGTAPPVSAEADQIARLIVGQWSINPADCPARVAGQPLDMTPSTGRWITMQYEAESLKVTSAGVTILEEIVGTQNGWLRTVTAGEASFYRVDDSGRLLLRYGDSEPTRLEPCI